MINGDIFACRNTSCCPVPSPTNEPLELPALIFMEHVATISAIGHYCGRFGPGPLGEPLNSLSNLAFVVGAIYSWRAWRASGTEDRWQWILIGLVACIGVGSFVFHTFPSPPTLMGDLVPIQVFGLVYMAYVGSRYFNASPIAVAVALAAFFLVRQFWIEVSPRGGLGGGMTHIPSLAVLVGTGVYFRLKGIRLGRFLLLASGTYVAALVVRSWDLPLCSTLPIGVHWAWHLLTASTATLLVYGIAVEPPIAERRLLFANGP